MAPLSTALTSPKVQRQLFDKLINNQKEARDGLTPNFIQDRPSLAERERKGPKMDAWWWTWNLAQACIPAMTVVAVCQFYKSDMEEFYRKQQLLDKNDLNGDSNDHTFIDGDDGNGDEKASVSKSPWLRENSSVLNAVVDVFGFQKSWQTSGKDDSNVGLIDEALLKQSYENGANNEKLEVDNKEKISSLEQRNEEDNIEQLICRIKVLEKRLGMNEADDFIEGEERQQTQSNIGRRRENEVRRRFGKNAESKEAPPKTNKFDIDLSKDLMEKSFEESMDTLFKRTKELKDFIIAPVDDTTEKVECAHENLKHPDMVGSEDVKKNPKNVEEDEVIIKQGDDGNNFYIIESGNVDVYIDFSNSNDPSELVNSYADGDSFGELAIMYNAPRAATCIANGGAVKDSL